MWSKIKKRIKSLLENLVTEVEEPEVATVENESIESETEVPSQSPKIVKVSVLSDDQKKITIDELEDMLREMLGSSKGSKKSPDSSHILITDGAQWYYDPINKQMIRVHSGTEVVLSNPDPDDDGRVLCYCDLGFIMVPFDNMSELGFN